MNKEVQLIRHTLSESLQGEPWYGQPLYTLLDKVDPVSVYRKPNEESHSLIDLLYHMITWAEFTENRLKRDKEKDDDYTDALDWREIDPTIHTWRNGITEIKAIHGRILNFLDTMDDAMLEEQVDFRSYNFRYLLEGLVQHNIYHLGQIAYAWKAL